MDQVEPPPGSLTISLTTSSRASTTLLGFWAGAPLSNPRARSVLLPDVPFFPSLGLSTRSQLPPPPSSISVPTLPFSPASSPPPSASGLEQEVMKMSCVPRRL